MPLICDLVSLDQMGFGVDNALNIVADMATVHRTARHGAGVGNRQLSLPVGRISRRFIHGRQAFYLLPDAVMSTG